LPFNLIVARHDRRYFLCLPKESNQRKGTAVEAALWVPDRKPILDGAAELALWAQTVLATTPSKIGFLSAASNALSGFRFFDL